MKKEDIKIGMRVVPFQKTAFSQLENSNTWKDALNKNQKYLYVIDWDDELNCFVLDDENINDGDNGDFFNTEDFKPYSEEDGVALQDKQKLFERFLNASFELKVELTNKLLQDQTYLTDKEQEFTLALSEWHKSI